MCKKLLLAGCFLLIGFNTDRAQLAITEVMSSASTTLSTNLVVHGADGGELSNFGTNDPNLGSAA